MPRSTAATAEKPDPSGVLVEGLDADFPAVVSRLYRRLRAEKASDQISDSQLSVLALLVKAGPHTLRELSDHEHVTPPSMNQTVNALADSGYVTRTGDPDDGRKVILVATAGGAALVAETRHRRHAWLNAQLHGLSAGERQNSRCCHRHHRQDRQLVSAERALKVSETISPRYKWLVLSNTTIGRAAGDHRLVDHADRDARHLPRHQAESPRPGQQLLPALDDSRVPDRQQRAGGEPRKARRHVRPGAHVQPRIRHLHVGLAGADHRPLDRSGGFAVVDHRPPLSGRRRRVPGRQFSRDHHRCVPVESARSRARHQQHRRDQRAVHRPDPRRRARCHRLAACLPGLGALRSLRDHLVVPQVSRNSGSVIARGSTGRATSPSRSAWC